MPYFGSFFCLVAAAVIAACSSTPIVAPPLPQAHQTIGNGRNSVKAELVLTIRVPKKKHAPRYISAATKGMAIAFSGPTTFTQVLGLTPSDPRCHGTPLVCTFDFRLAPGAYRTTVKTYDQAPLNGLIPSSAKLLSTASGVAFTVTRGIANHIGITLDGVPASISVSGFPSASAGTAFSSESFSVTVKDADAYLIVGTYSTPIALTDSDTSGATSVATKGSDHPPAGELLGSSDTPTISYTGRAINPVTIRASAGAVSGSGIFAVRLPVFVAIEGTVSQNGVHEIPPGCGAANCVTSLGGSGMFPAAVAVDGSGNVFVADAGNNAVKKIPPGCDAANCVTTLGGGFSAPFGVAVDGSGDVFVADTGNSAVKEIPPGCGAAGCVIAPGDGAFKTPYGVAVDGSGNVFVADTGDNAAKEIPPGCYDAACVSTVRSGLNSPEGVAVDGSDNVFVADTGNNAVKLVLHSCTKFCVIVFAGAFSSPQSVAVDGSGNVFVGDSGHSVVEEYPAGCFTASCSSTIGGGFEAVYGVAVL